MKKIKKNKLFKTANSSITSNTSMSSISFWSGKRVFLTGNTGFKGSWLTIWLDMLGAKVYGYALNPPTKPSLFKQAKVKKLLYGQATADIRDYQTLFKSIKKVKPDIIIHMAAQPLVRDSYIIPRETYEINVMGTVNLFESIRRYPCPKVVLNITTDKVYENRERLEGYKENEPLGGYDPYSSSKAASELVTSAYRSSFFSSNLPRLQSSTLPFISSARAGNVIGGGDWAKDRLIPDIIRAIIKNEKVLIRNPYSIRPWQYVLESLSGYMLLCEKMYEEGEKYSGAWNFGPDEKDLKEVDWLVKRLLLKIKPNKGYRIDKGNHPHEAKFLVLNTDKSKNILGWKTKWNIETAIDKTAEWVNDYRNKNNVLEICQRQIEEYMQE